MPYSKPPIKKNDLVVCMCLMHEERCWSSHGIGILGSSMLIVIMHLVIRLIVTMASTLIFKVSLTRLSLILDKKGHISWD